MQIQTETMQANNAKFMDVQGVDKIEILWLNGVMGTAFMVHPVTKTRARKILNEVLTQTNKLALISHQAA